MGGSLRAGLLGVDSVGGTESPLSRQQLDHQHYLHHHQQHQHHHQQQHHQHQQDQQLSLSSRRSATSRIASSWRSFQSLILGRTVVLQPSFGGLALLTAFPTRVAMWAGVVKLLVGLMMAFLGGVGIVTEAALSSLGGGLWAGAVVAVSGFLAVCASRQPLSQVYIVSLLGVSLLSLSASGLLLLLSAAACAADTGLLPQRYLQQAGLPPSHVAGEQISPAVLVSASLVLLAVLDCLVSASCVAIAARQLCRSLGGLRGPGARGFSEGHNRKERLYRWLGQQKTIFPIGTAASGVGRGIDTSAASVPSVCQFVPLTESSSTASLDQLASHEGSLDHLASHDARNSHSTHPHHSTTIFPSYINHSNNNGNLTDRSTYSSRRVMESTTPRSVNTFAKYANMNGAYGRYNPGQIESGHYNKNIYPRNTYSRKSKGKLGNSLIYSGGSTLHSTFASTSTRPTKSGHSTATTKNSTGSSQLTASAYLSSSSESRHPKSNISFPVRTKFSKSPHKFVPSLNQYPSLPHLPPSNASVLGMMPPPPPSLQYSKYRRANKPSSERYFQPQYPTLHHMQMLQQNQYAKHHSYYTLQHKTSNPMSSYQSLPHQNSVYIQRQPLQYSRSIHSNMYYPQYINGSMPRYAYIQGHDTTIKPAKKKFQRPYVAVHSSKLTPRKKKRTLKGTKTRGSPIGGNRKRTKELTDEQIDKSYTGLDRTIAEGFIGTMMEPAMSTTTPRPMNGYYR